MTAKAISIHSDQGDNPQKEMASACHVRSISLPSRPHQSTLDVDVQLQRLRSSQSASSSSDLSGLKDLYESIDGFLQLQATQQVISDDDNSMNKTLDGSLRLLDVCGATRDIFSQMKEILKELQSSLRRKRGSELVEAYISAKKQLSKEVCKCLRNLKSSQKKNCSSSQEKDSSIVVVTLRQAEEACLEIFDSLLAMISCPKPKTGRWSLVSELMQSKRVSCEGEISGIYSVERMEGELMALRSSKDITSGQLKNLLKGLEGIELSIQEVEEELGCVYKLLVKTRASILNILSH